MAGTRRYWVFHGITRWPILVPGVDSGQSNTTVKGYGRTQAEALADAKTREIERWTSAYPALRDRASEISFGSVAHVSGPWPE